MLDLIVASAVFVANRYQIAKMRLTHIISILLALLLGATLVSIAMLPVMTGHMHSWSTP